jgi:hypothetical protein
VAAHAGANTLTGKFPPHFVCGAAFEALGKNRYRQRGWMCDQQVHVVGLTVELDQLGIEVGAQRTWWLRRR